MDTRSVHLRDVIFLYFDNCKSKLCSRSLSVYLVSVYICVYQFLYASLSRKQTTKNQCYFRLLFSYHLVLLLDYYDEMYSLQI